MSHTPSFTSPSSATTIIANLTNHEAASVPMCTPVYSDAPGAFKMAVGDGSSKATLIGLVCDLLIPAAAIGNILGVGVLTAAASAWDVVCGTSGGLAAGVTYYLHATVPGKLTTDASSNVPVIEGLSPTIALLKKAAGGVVGPGTALAIPKFIGAAAIGNSTMADDGAVITITNDPPVLRFMQNEVGFSNPATQIGGLVPGSPLNPALPNFGNFQGQGLSLFKYPVGFNGCTAPLYSIDILSDEHNQTADDIKINIGWAGGFDNSLAPRTGYAIKAACNAPIDVGGHPQTNIGLWGDATNGNVNYALRCERGDARIDGNTFFGDAAKLCTINGTCSIQTSATVAQASNPGTGLEIASGAAHNYLSFRNPDATDCGIAVSNVTNGGDGYLTYKRAVGWTIGAQNATIGTISPQSASFTGALGTGNAFISSAAGTPNGNVVGNPGDLFLNRSGGAGNTLWVKESGNGTNTGWVAK